MGRGLASKYARNPQLDNRDPSSCKAGSQDSHGIAGYCLPIWVASPLPQHKYPTISTQDAKWSINLRVPSLSSIVNMNPHAGRPENHSYIATDLNICLVTFSTLIVIARLYSRLGYIKSFGLDDAIALLAWVYIFSFKFSLRRRCGN